MTSNAAYSSRYDQRVSLVTEAIVRHSKLTKVIAGKLAVDVLAALDHIPEKVR
jgi:hypothetical protein